MKLNHLFVIFSMIVLIGGCASVTTAPQGTNIPQGVPTTNVPQIIQQPTPGSQQPPTGQQKRNKSQSTNFTKMYKMPYSKVFESVLQAVTGLGYQLVSFDSQQGFIKATAQSGVDMIVKFNATTSATTVILNILNPTTAPTVNISEQFFNRVHKTLTENR